MSNAKIQEKADEVRLLLLEKAESMAKSNGGPFAALIAAEMVRRVSDVTPVPMVPVLREDIAGMVGIRQKIEPVTNHVVDVDVGERGEIKRVALTSPLAPQITLYRCADGAFRTDPNWTPPGPTAELVPLTNGAVLPAELVLFENPDGAWRSDPDWQPPPPPAPPAPDADPRVPLLETRLKHFREALEFIGATRYGLAARQALAEDAAFVADPTQPLTFTPPPPRKGPEDAPASVPPPVVVTRGADPFVGPDPNGTTFEPMATAAPAPLPPPVAPAPPVAEEVVVASSASPAPPPAPAPVQPRWPTGCHTAWGIAPENITKSGLAVLVGDSVEFTDLGSTYLSPHVKIAWTGLLLSEGINVAPVSVDPNVSRFLAEGQRVRLRGSGAIGRLVKLPVLSPSA